MNFDSLPRWFLWCLVLPLIVLNGWVMLKLFEYFQSFFTIAIAATLISFILSYPVNWLQRAMGRAQAVGVVLLGVVAVIAIAMVTLLPMLFSQLSDLASRLPGWISSSSNDLAGLQSWVSARQLPIDITATITQLESRLSAQLQALSGLIIGALPDAVANVLDIFLMLVLSIYLLLHGKQVWQSLFHLLPAPTGKRLQTAISQSFHGYFISQAAVALMMGTSMTIAFLVIRVPFGLLFGIAIGLLGMVPFGAALGIVMVSAIAAFKSVWLGLRVLIVATVIDQILENAIAPSLVGGLIGLNPVWVLVSLLIGTKIAGVLGLIVAVPVASAIRAMIAAPEPIAPVHPPDLSTRKVKLG